MMLEFIKPIVIVGLIGSGVFYYLDNHNKESKANLFLEKVNLIDNEIRISALESFDKKPNINNLPKTIKIEYKEYALDYTQEFLTVKNFNDSFYCNKTFSATTTDSNKTFVLGSREIHTKCENNNMLIIYNKKGN